MRKRRPAPEISLSFLDVICCGFGAVILLLMITKTVEPQVLEESTVIAEGRVAELTQQLESLKADIQEFNEVTAPKIVEDLHAQIIEKNKVLSEEIQTYLQQLKADNIDVVRKLVEDDIYWKQRIWTALEVYPWVQAF